MTAALLAAALLAAAVILTAAVWFDRRLLTDLAATNDRDLHHFGRTTWALIIIVSFPVGPFRYLRYAKGLGRFG